jgi:hypothetical protein
MKKFIFVIITLFFFLVVTVHTKINRNPINHNVHIESMDNENIDGIVNNDGHCSLYETYD